MPVNAEIRGLAETQRKLEQVVTDLRGEEFKGAMSSATLLVQGDAKRLAPVDTGRLRSSIVPEVRMMGRTVQGVVGSTVEYAPYMELGTGEHVGKAPYFPPPRALDTWARRHGIASGFIVTRAIFKAGGVKGRKFLQGAFEKNKDRIVRLLENAVTGIVRK